MFRQDGTIWAADAYFGLPSLDTERRATADQT